MTEGTVSLLAGGGEEEEERERKKTQFPFSYIRKVISRDIEGN